MKLWKRNAVVAAIVLFVCAAVYLNWSYSQEKSDVSAGALPTGKLLGGAALVGASADPGMDPVVTPSAGADASTPPEAGERQRLFFQRPHQPPAGPGLCTEPSGGGCRQQRSGPGHA